MLKPGDSAPSFQTVTVDGVSVSLADLLLRGPVVLAFFKVSCPTCQLTMPFLDRIARDGKPGSPSIVAISQDDRDSTRRFNTRFGIHLPTLIDAKPTYQASNAYALTNVPTIYSIGSGGDIEWAFTGFVKEELVKLGLDHGVSTFRAGERVPAMKPG